MRCPSCHHDDRSDRRFCTQCGTRLAAGCPSCGAPIELDEKFCGGCGTALTIGGQTTPPSRAPAPILAEKIRHAKATVEGERKQVTVLFVDVKGSMELAEQLDPEVWSQIMQRFFRILSDGIERFEGFVDKFTGDGGMALFGAPIAHEDHAQRACYAALHLRDAVRSVRERGPRPARRPVRGPHRAQLGRGRGRANRRRPAHGVHGPGTRRRPRATHGGARRVGAHLSLGAHRAARRGVLPAPGSRPNHGQGRE